MAKNWQETVMSPSEVFNLVGYGIKSVKGQRKVLEAQAKATWEARQPEVDETRKAVATDIGQMLCILAGNLMMEDKEAGSLLATQLQPIMDYLKTKYIPDLPRMATVETIINKQVDEVVEWVNGNSHEQIPNMYGEIKFHSNGISLVITADEWQAFLKKASRKS